MTTRWWLAAWVGVVVLGLAGAGIGIGLGFTASSVARPAGTTGVVQPLPQQVNERQAPVAGTIASIAEQVLPSVVSILVEAGLDSGSGSGFVVRADGYIVTNNHVIDAAVDSANAEVTVVFEDGTRSAATIVGRNISADIAVLQVGKRDLQVAVWGDSSVLAVGDAVIAIGAPLGLAGTVTSGIVSALDRPVTTGSAAQTAFINAIQTDAPINPGNSGGPLLNGAGEVVGVNSAIATLAAGGELGSIGLGFAIPARSAERIAAELIASGSSLTPVIGVSLDPAYRGSGALIDTVNPGGPAERAGLVAGDVIIAVDGQPVDTAEDLIIAIRDNAPGDTIELTVLGGGAEFVVAVRLGGDRRE